MSLFSTLPITTVSLSTTTPFLILYQRIKMDFFTVAGIMPNSPTDLLLWLIIDSRAFLSIIERNSLLR